MTNHLAAFRTARMAAYASRGPALAWAGLAAAAACADAPTQPSTPAAAVAAAKSSVAVDCPSYCQLAVAFCGQHPVMALTLDDCPGRCAQLPVGPGLGELTGDTLSCRLGYALLAMTDGSQWCREASVEGGVACRDGQDLPVHIPPATGSSP